MGEVIVTFRVMPTGVDVNLDELEKAIRDSVKPEVIKREPIAFGISSVNVTTMVPDEAGQLDKVQDKLKALKGVNDVEVTEICRSL